VATGAALCPDGATFYPLKVHKLNGLNPDGYLHEVFECIGDDPITRVEQLVPWNIGHHAN
jgi:hypothetical protein